MKKIILLLTLLLVVAHFPELSMAQTLSNEGGDQGLAVCSDSTVWGWGANGTGQLGDNSTTDHWAPVKVHGPGNVGFLSGITSIASGVSHSVAIQNGGTVWAWGSNALYTLGDNTLVDELTPIQVHGPGNVGFLTGITQVSARYHSLALKNDGSVWGWGRNVNGQLGDGTTVTPQTPIQVHGPGNVGFLTGVAAICAGGDALSLVLKTDGTVWCWGYNGYGQLGDNSTNSTLTAVQVHGPGNVGFLTGIIAIAGGWEYSLALKNDGTVWTWGRNQYGALGDNSLTDSPVPVQVHGVGNIGYLTGITQLSAGWYHAVAVQNTGSVYTWGQNSNGQLGDNTTINSLTPVQVHGPGNVGFLSGITFVSGALAFCHALKNDGTIWAWGEGGPGELGDGTAIQRNTPVQITLCPIVVITATATSTNTSCNGGCDGTATVVPAGGTSPYTYVWSNGQTTSTDTGLCAGSYVVTVTDAAGVTTTATATITQPSPIVLVTSSTSATCSASNGTATVSASGGTQPYFYLWSSSSTSTIAINLSAGDYTVVVSDSSGCSNSATVAVTSNSAIDSLTLGNDTSLCPGNVLVLNAGTFANYIWQDNSTQPMFTVTNPGTYWVHVMDSFGCAGADSIIVTEVCNDELFVPNAFSPNGDGFNDFFRAIGINVGYYHLQVYSRWGQLLFESNEINLGWDGIFKGLPQPIGTYGYVITYAGITATTQTLNIKKGNVTLVR